MRLSARNQISHRAASRYPRELQRPHHASYQYRGAHKRQRSASSSFAQAASGLCSGGSFKNKGKAKAGYKAKAETKPKERQGGYKATPRVEKPTTTANGRPICFNCNEPGHISKSCPNPKKDRGEGKKVSQLKASPGQKEDKKSVRTPTGWLTLTALIDSGANENFIPHLRAAELSIKPGLDEATPRVTTIDEAQLQVYGYTAHAPGRRTLVGPPESLIDGY
ncbi:MAG: hypothetical protein M1816_003272 [Peltula sp. TS41687]|nr:MAG: hypothetical protein M1816_003272 [Peltula sp. TS41687]